jgi:hypothetical protein
MVVSYYHYRGMPLGIKGYFQADEAIDSALRDTEPHEHNDWNEATSGDKKKEQRQLANTIKKEIRVLCKKYLENYSPPPDIEPHLLPKLRRYLSTLLATTGTGPPPKESDNISITNKSVGHQVIDSSVVLNGSAVVTNRSTIAGHFRIGASVKVVESDISNSGDFIEISIDSNGQTVGPTLRPEVVLHLLPNQSTLISFSSIKLNPDWKYLTTFWAENVDQ